MEHKWILCYCSHGQSCKVDGNDCWHVNGISGGGGEEGRGCGGGGRVASIQTRRVHCWRGKITSSNLAIFPQSYDSLKIVRMSDCSVAPVLHLYAWFRALQCGVLFMSQAGFYPGSANGNHIFSWWPRWTILSGGRSQHPHWSGTTVLEIQQISSQISYKKPTTLYEGRL